MFWRSSSRSSTALLLGALCFLAGSRGTTAELDEELGLNALRCADIWQSNATMMEERACTSFMQLWYLQIGSGLRRATDLSNPGNTTNFRQHANCFGRSTAAACGITAPEGQLGCTWCAHEETSPENSEFPDGFCVVQNVNRTMNTCNHITELYVKPLLKYEWGRPFEAGNPDATPPVPDIPAVPAYPSVADQADCMALSFHPENCTSAANCVFCPIPERMYAFRDIGKTDWTTGVCHHQVMDNVTSICQLLAEIPDAAYPLGAALSTKHSLLAVVATTAAALFALTVGL